MSRRRPSPLFQNLTAPGGMISRIAARRKGSHRRPDRANSTRYLALEILEDRLCLDSSSRFSEFSVPTSSYPGAITTGPDDALWFTEPESNKIGRTDPLSGQITEYVIPSQNSPPSGITAGPDDAVWFTEEEANKIGRIDPMSSQITEYDIPTQYGYPVGITAGPDDALWFTDSDDMIVRIDTNGNISEYFGCRNSVESGQGVM